MKEQIRADVSEPQSLDLYLLKKSKVPQWIGYPLTDL